MQSSLWNEGRKRHLDEPLTRQPTAWRTCERRDKPGTKGVPGYDLFPSTNVRGVVAGLQLLRGNHEQLFESCLALNENSTVSHRIRLARRAYATTYSICAATIARPARSRWSVPLCGFSSSVLNARLVRPGDPRSQTEAAVGPKSLDRYGQVLPTPSQTYGYNDWLVARRDSGWQSRVYLK